MKVHSCIRKAIFGDIHAQKGFLVLEGLRISLKTLRLFLDKEALFRKISWRVWKGGWTYYSEKEMYVSAIKGFGGEHRLKIKDKRVD